MKATNGPEQSQNRGYSRQNRAQGTRIYKSHLKNLEVAWRGGGGAGALGSRVEGAVKLIL
jgi:hypothetical protein